MSLIMPISPSPYHLSNSYPPPAPHPPTPTTKVLNIKYLPSVPDHPRLSSCSGSILTGPKS